MEKSSNERSFTLIMFWSEENQGTLTTKLLWSWCFWFVCVSVWVYVCLYECVGVCVGVCMCPLSSLWLAKVTRYEEERSYHLPSPVKDNLHLSRKYILTHYTYLNFIHTTAVMLFARFLMLCVQHVRLEVISWWTWSKCCLFLATFSGFEPLDVCGTRFYHKQHF